MDTENAEQKIELKVKEALDKLLEEGYQAAAKEAVERAGEKREHEHGQGKKPDLDCAPVQPFDQQGLEVWHQAACQLHAQHGCQNTGCHECPF